MTQWRVPPGLTAGFLIAAVLAIWEITPRVIDLPAAFVTTPSRAIADIVERPARYGTATVDTITEFVPALLLAGVGGVVLGVLLGALPGGRFGRTYLATLYAIPTVMLYPLLTAWFGLGSPTRIIFGGIYGLIPVTLTVAASVSSIDRDWIESARSLGASTTQTLARVVVPLTVPGIFSALRAGGGLAFVGVVLGELLASNRGLGFLLTSARTSFDVDGLYASVILVLLLALALNLLLAVAERALSPWPAGLGKSAR